VTELRDSLLNLPDFRAAFVLPYVLAALLHMACEPARWSVYTRGRAAIPFSRFFHIFSATALLGYLLPLKLGLPIRVALLRTKAGLPLTHVVTLLTLDGIVYYAPWFLLSAVFIGQALVRVDLRAGLGAWSAVLALVAVLVLMLLIRLSSRYRQRAAHGTRGPSRLAGQLKEAVAMLGVLEVGLATGIVLVNVAAIVVVHWALIEAVGQSLPIGTVCVVTVVSVFAGLVSFTPMGLGSYDAALVLLLTDQSLPLGAALAVPALHRVGMLAITAVVGAWSGSRLALNPFRASTRAHLREVARGGDEDRR
jgi:uncharacterized membrane protein YbhN (UPF0104 family)